MIYKIVLICLSVVSYSSIFAKDYRALGEEAFETGKIKEAVTFFEAGASSGDGFCCYRLSTLFFGDTELGQDIDKSICWAKKGQTLKDPFSTGLLGYLYWIFREDPRDLNSLGESIGLMAQACEAAPENDLNDPFFGSLATVLASYYAEMNENIECKKWLNFVTKHYLTSPDIIANISYIYLVLQDYENAYKYACLSNNTEKLYSNFVIGFCLANGVGGVGQDPDQAYRHMKIAAMIGMPNGKSEYMMGVFNELGIGCKTDLQAAKEWYMKAAQKGDNQGLEKIKKLH